MPEAASINGHYDQHEQASVMLAASPEAAFAMLDDHRHLSSHMEASSLMMAGTSMRLERDEGDGRELGSHIRMQGRVLGMRLALDEVVVERVPPWRKAWETVGEPRLLVIGRYRMGFTTEALQGRSRVTVWIDYALPAASPWLGRLAGRAYARWYTARMARDAVAQLAAATA